MVCNNNNTEVLSTVDTYSYAILNRGFNYGITKWGFKIIKESVNDLLLGVCQFPINNNDYTESNDMWMIKCSNGNLYNNGKSQTSKIKIEKNTIINFVLDMNEGTLTLNTGNRQPIILFNQLEGKTLYPCILTASSDRTVELCYCEGPSSVSIDFLYNLSVCNKENLIENKNFGIKSNLGYEIKDGNNGNEVINKAHIPYLPSIRGISMRPDSNSCCSISYDLDGKYAYLDFIVYIFIYY